MGSYAGPGTVMEYPCHDNGTKKAEGRQAENRNIEEKIMKKKAGMFAAAFASALLLTGCGDKEFIKDIKASDYVTLGNYMGIEASAQAPYVQDGLVDYYIENQYLTPNMLTREEAGRAVEEGDTANIDFVGYQDGEAFAGGTGQGYNLTIGSGQFIEGFEEGLIGVEIGETVSLDLTFPDPYDGNPDLSGAPVVFDVTVNGILPELTDEFVQSLGIGSCQTGQELKDLVYDLYYQSAVADYENEIEMIMSSTIMAGCTFKKEPPAGLVERYETSIEVTQNRQAANSGMTLSQYMQVTTGLDEAGYRAEFKKAATEMAQRYIMYQAIADIEGLTPTEEEVQKEIDTMVQIYGYTSEAELLQQENRENISEDLMRKNVVAFLMENGNIQQTGTNAE